MAFGMALLPYLVMRLWQGPHMVRRLGNASAPPCLRGLM